MKTLENANPDRNILTCNLAINRVSRPSTQQVERIEQPRKCVRG